MKFNSGKEEFLFSIKVSWLILSLFMLLLFLFLILAGTEAVNNFSAILHTPHQEGSCPFCGMTRAALALRDGNFAASMNFNPLFAFITAATILNLTLIIISEYKLKIYRSLFTKS